MKLHLGKLSLAVFLNFSIFLSSVQAELSQITFEAVEWVPMAPIGTNSQSGWQLYSGNALVSPNGEGYTGGKALLIPANAQQETMISRQITWNTTDQTAFIDMMLKPAADPEGSLATLYANGTQLAFQVEQGSGTGSIWVYHGNDGVVNPTAQPEQWVQTVGSFHVAAGTMEADTYLRVTLRHDYQRNLWDLFVDGKLAAANLSFEGRGSNLSSVDFYGSLVGPTHVDNLAALSTNMLFPDADKDGLSDSWETANGSNPNLYDRDAIKSGTGSSYLDLYMASLWSGGGVNASTGVPVSGSIPPITILGNHQPVGALKGTLSVGGEGNAIYTLPIDIPKGSGGMEPKISLGYSSGGGSGLCGLGWNLNGFQRITRGPASPLKDGSYDPADFDSSDRYFFEGERLICISGIYGAAGSEYRTEFDSFSRITAIGAAAAGSGPNYWKVETKAGLIIYLGGTADSKMEVPQGTLSWGVNKVEDTVGNYYTVVYTRDSATGQPLNFINDRVSAVHYTGNTAMSLNPYCHIYFEYKNNPMSLTDEDNRPDNSRAYTTYAGYKSSKRLTKIKVMTDNFVNYAYRIGYETSYQTGRSLLKTVTKAMQDDDAFCVPPTTFNYDGLQSGQPIWLDPGDSQLPTYSTNVDATEEVNSMVTTEDNHTTIRLTGDVARAYAIPNGVTLYSDSKIQFEFKSDTLSLGAVMGLDTNTTYDLDYEDVADGDPSPLFRMGGTGSIRMAPDLTKARSPTVTPNFVGPTQPYTPGQGWKTFTLNAAQWGTGLRNYLVLMSADNTIADGTSEALFKNIRIYRSNTQQPTDVSPIVFNLDTELPRFSASNGKDLGVVSIDLNADGLPDLADWRVINYTISSGVLSPVTVGNVYRNTGSGFVLDNTIRPPTEAPLSVRAANDTAYKYCQKHHLLAQPADINNDGRLDLVCSVNLQQTGSVLKNDYWFYTWQGSSWGYTSGGFDLPFRYENVSSSDGNGGKRRDYHFQWIDLNTDGYTDLSLYTSAHGRLYDRVTNALVAGGETSVVFINPGNGTPVWTRDDSLLLPEKLMDLNSGDPQDCGRRILDLEGDGIVDIAEAWYSGSTEVRHTYKINPTGTYRWNSNPGMQNPAASVYDLPIGLANADGLDKRGANIFDCNGDGLADILQFAKTGNGPQKNTWLNEGYRAASPWVLQTAATTTAGEKDSYVLPVPLQMESNDVRVAYGFEQADLNGDGLLDILYANEATTYTAGPDNLAILNTGNGWLQRAEWGMPGTNLICTNNTDRTEGRRRAKLQDINGDGFPDLVTDILNLTPKVWYNQCRPEVITSVTDGFGSQFNVEYKRLNDPAVASPLDTGFGTRVYTRGEGGVVVPDGQTSVMDGRLVVARYSEPDGLTVNGQRYKDQRYSDLRYDNVNQVSLGFQLVQAKDETTGQISETYTKQQYPFNGSPTLTRTYVPVTAADLAENNLAARLPGVTPGLKLLSKTTAIYDQLTPQIGVGGTIRRIVQTSSVETRYDLDGLTKISEFTTSQPMASFDAYGFVTQYTVTALDGSTVVTNSSYSHSTDPTHWHLGRLTESNVVKSGAGKPTISKAASFTYNSSSGLLSSETAQAMLTKSYGRDGFGNITTTTASASGASRSSFSTYDSRGRFVTREQNALGQHVDFYYDEAKSLLRSSSDMNGKATWYTYDAFGTLILTSYPDGTKTAEITGYANNNSLPSSVVGQTSNPIKYFRAKQSSGGVVAKVYLDALGRELVTETTILRNNNSTGASRYSKAYATTCYDGRGRKVAFSEPFSPSEVPKFTTVSYDMLDRPMVTMYEVTDRSQGTNQTGKPKDQVVTFRAESATDGYGVTRICSYSKTANRNGMTLERWEDEHGRMIQSRDPSQPDAAKSTVFKHDHEGRVVAVAVGGNALLANTYDVIGNKIAVWEANSGTSSSTYNSFSEITGSTNAKEETTFNSYDSLGRISTIVKPEGSYTMYYDGAAGAGIGKPWKTTGPSGYSEEIAYDGLGRSIATTKTQFGETFTTTMSYTALGLPLTETDAGGLMVIHEYDATYSFPLSLKIGPGVEGAGTLLWKAGTYDSKGRPTSQILAQGITSSASYHAGSGMLENLTSTVSGNTLQNKTCVWDSLGNLTSRTDSLTHLEETFSYDGLNRVISATTALLPGAGITTVPPPQTYKYDDSTSIVGSKGNLTERKSGSNTIASMTYGGSGIGPHAVASATVKGASRTYAYDAAGYVISDSLRSYTWTSFGQLQTLDYAAAPAVEDLNGTPVYGSASIHSTFDFDAGGNRAKQLKERIASTDNRVLEETLYLGSYEREEHTTKASNTATPVLTKTVHRHTLGGIGVYTRAVNASTGTTIKLTTVLKDHLGSTSVLYVGSWNGTAFVNQVIEGQSFDPWGERRNANTGENFRVASTDTQRVSTQDYDRGYTGHEQLDESGLIHMNGRIYDPEIGRFLSPDPYVQVPQYSQNFNRYSYVLNNPLNSIDPSGFNWLSKQFNKLGKWLGEDWCKVVVIVVYAVVYFYAGPQAASATAAGLSTALSGGSSGDVYKAGAVAYLASSATQAISGYASGATSSMVANTAIQVAGTAVVSGAANAAMGGKFEDGFISGATSAALSAGAGAINADRYIGDIGVQAVVGGTVSVVGGGKFGNGAAWSAFSYLVFSGITGNGNQLGAFNGISNGIRNMVNSRSWSDVGRSTLQILGLPRDFFDPWVNVADYGGTGGGRAPLSIAKMIGGVGVPKEIHPEMNGAHAWHGGTNSMIGYSLGLGLGTPAQWLAGLYHETIDFQAVKSEINNQGVMNTILDSSMDIITNTFGMASGYLSPNINIARNIGVYGGNYIPGPMDRDVMAGGDGGTYKQNGGNPLATWGKYP